MICYCIVRITHTHLKKYHCLRLLYLSLNKYNILYKTTTTPQQWEPLPKKIPGTVYILNQNPLVRSTPNLKKYDKLQNQQTLFTKQHKLGMSEKCQIFFRRKK